VPTKCIDVTDPHTPTDADVDTDATEWRSPPGAFGLELETHRRELTGHCRRVLGSGFEAEDAVQETMVRAWRRIDGFEGRSSLRSWLYRIATNVCLDMRRRPQRRAQPMHPAASSDARAALDPAGWDATWPSAAGIAPVAAQGEPAELATAREEVRLAFVAALQLLAPRQRAVLILREVLRWHATEVAELLGTSVASVNSALQRARATLDAASRDATDPTAVDGEQREHLARYVDAFERYDVSALVSLVRANP
jgi:RNA polymerase sigma-70 factor, ECF subfamily